MWCERCQAGPGGCLCGIREAVKRLDRERLVDFLVSEGVLKAMDDQWVHPGMRTRYVVLPPEPPKRCAHCDEQIEPWTFSVSAQPGPQWRHIANGSRQCQVLAEPG